MKNIIIFFLIISYNNILSQNIAKKKPKINKYIFAFIPSAAHNIYGIELGLLGTEIYCNKSYTQNSYGINIQILGQGFMQIFYITKNIFKSNYNSNSINNLEKRDTIIKKVIHNGLVVSSFGTFTSQINGVSLSPFMSKGEQINGISFNLLWNFYDKANGLSIAVINDAIIMRGLQFGLINKTANTKGLQIGFFNKTLDLIGFQIGLWNKNKKRSLPFFNWSFH